MTADAPRRSVAVAAAAAWVLLTLVLTLRPIAGAASGSHWVVTGPEAFVADAIANVGFFMPLGALLVLARLRVREAALAALLLSAAIEVTQGFGIPGRFASLSDLACNAMGGALGALIAARADRLVRPSRMEARVLVGGWASVVAAVLALTTWLQAPGAPSAAYDGQHAQDWNRERDSTHAVRDARLDGRSFQWGVLPTANFANASLAARRLRLEVRVDPGVSTPGVHRIAAVSELGYHYATLARLETDGRDLRFSVRMRGAAFGLHAPYVRLADALPAPSLAPREPLQLGGAREGNSLVAWVHDGDRTAIAVHNLSPIDGWQFVLPSVITARLGSTVLRWGEALLLFAPLAWWIACLIRTGPERANEAGLFRA